MESWLAAPAVTVMGADETLTNPGAANSRVRSPTLPVIERLVKLANPEPLVATVAVPPSVPPPGRRLATPGYSPRRAAESPAAARTPHRSAWFWRAGYSRRGWCRRPHRA